MPDTAFYPGSTAHRVAVTAFAVVVVLVVGSLLRVLSRGVLRHRGADKPRFWAEQAISLATLVAIVLVVAAVWADDFSNLGGMLGVLGAGVAVALQRVITSFAGYLIILRGNVFTVGDRITIGGVRGDVVALGFMQTTVLEMGQTPAEQTDDPSMWIRGRQYSGRIVRITNDRIFDEPVYNFTRGFAFTWEEIMIPVRYGDPHARVESIMLDAAE